MEGNGKTVWVIGALIVGLVAGYFVGDARGGAMVEEKYAPLIDLAYPPVPSVLHSLTGTVQQLYGASFALTIPDPNDYLPHLDGSARRTGLRMVNVSANTAFREIDQSALIRGGEPITTSFLFGGLRTGDTVTVQSAENIRDARTIEATVVERLTR